MKTIRKLHFYIGTLFAPTIIFFALSGAFQILGLHEGSSAVGWIAKLSLVHKDQTIDSPPPRAKPAAPVEQPRAPQAPPPERHRSYPLVMWFLALALGLMVSTCLGIYMAFAYKRDRVVILSLLAAGIVLPLVFAFL